MMAKFETRDQFIASIDSPEHAQKLTDLLDWITATFPQLEPRMAWNQPMFTAHETFIIGFSVTKKNLMVSVEDKTIDLYRPLIESKGYTTTKRLIRMPWEEPWQRDLLTTLIQFNLEDKANLTSFWRPKE